MENDNAQTFEALSKYIESQRALLARTQSDIGRLRQLREDAVLRANTFFDQFSEKLNDSAFHLNGQLDVPSEVQHTIDWSLFKGKDVSRLRTFTSELRAGQNERGQPSSAQRCPLSPLQILVKDARRTIIDPVLTTLAFSSDSSSSEEEELTPEERRKERERQKIRELRMRRIGEGGLTLPRGRESGVYIRRDLVDESAEVDISLNEGGDSSHDVLLAAGVSLKPGPLSSIEPPALSPRPLPAASRTRRTKLRSDSPLPSTQSKAKLMATLKTKPITATDSDIERHPSRRSEKPRPETYKQAWSVSEQHLLERLLGEIPDGEKNRWAKISKAMNGRRTPRQVASRVQKYFEKLKRFGVDISAGSGATHGQQGVERETF
ncbi:hypothetical protein BV25DRAFT_1917052 [Artomyces pyxidatus]|uniref:Uncharacterized protein n=1 Tax=Artomyces pyxidatus TaxID=48021 RepID=A0ACB8SWV5_9AGAM|nr:hypothetical protein BV25DRAFT_1917052 [Artomyces pyxidatus]